MLFKINDLKSFAHLTAKKIPVLESLFENNVPSGLQLL